MVAQHINRFAADTGPNSWDVFREVFREVGVKAVARAIRVSAALLYKWQEPSNSVTESGALNPLDRIAEITRLTGDTRLVEWLCHQAGGVFVPLPAPVSDVARCINLAARTVIVELAETVDEFVDATADGVICQAEALSIRTRWQASVGSVESVVRATERGLFAAEGKR